MTDKAYWNTIINLQLLDESRNKSKQDMPLKDWVEAFKPDMDAQLIPRNVNLDTSDIDIFFKERKKLLAQKLRDVFSI